MHRFALAVSIAGAVLGVLAVGFSLSTSAEDSPPTVEARAHVPQLAADSASSLEATPTKTPTSATPATATVTASATNTATATATSTAEFRMLNVSQGEHQATVNAELALTPQQWQKGLMGRTELSDEQGMLFVFPANQTGGFWMYNTLIPLDIAYLDSSGVVMEIRHGVPNDLTELKPAQPYRHVLEVAGGWFDRKGMSVGAQVSIPNDLP